MRCVRPLIALPLSLLIASSGILAQQRTTADSSTFGRPIEAYEVRPGYIVTVSRDEQGRLDELVVEKGSVAGRPVAAERFTERVVDEIIEQLAPPSVRGNAGPVGSAVVCFTECYETRNYENLTVTEAYLDMDPTKERTRLVFQFGRRDGEQH
jgi:hypothetical protein